jgi:hypothetical protein
VSAAGEPERGEPRLAVDIRRIRQRLDPGALSNPQVSTELQELYKQVMAELDQRRGRHRLSPGSPAAPVVVAAPVVPRPVRDARGFDLKPNPLAASTSAELVVSLRRYREWSGDTPFRKMAAQARQKVSSSRMCTALRNDSLPTLKVVLAIVEGCGGSPDDQRAFATAWRRIKRDAWPAADAPALRAVPQAAEARG